MGIFSVSLKLHQKPNAEHMLIVFNDIYLCVCGGQRTPCGNQRSFYHVSPEDQVQAAGRAGST